MRPSCTGSKALAKRPEEAGEKGLQRLDAERYLSKQEAKSANLKNPAQLKRGNQSRYF
jgi:hypothetical protein